MSDPFAMALGALFRGPASVAAEYQVEGGEVIPLRVIRSRPDEEVDRGDSRYVVSTNHFEIQRSDVPQPAQGATLKTFALDGDGNPSLLTGTFELVGEPMLDVEGLTYTCGAVELE